MALLSRTNFSWRILVPLSCCHILCSLSASCISVEINTLFSFEGCLWRSTENRIPGWLSFGRSRLWRRGFPCQYRLLPVCFLQMLTYGIHIGEAQCDFMAIAFPKAIIKVITTLAFAFYIFTFLLNFFRHRMYHWQIKMQSLCVTGYQHFLVLLTMQYKKSIKKKKTTC